MLPESTALAGSYSWPLVVLSVVLAICSSYAALDLAGRVAVSLARARWIWLACGATAMGCGIWSMHYIGMLAFRLPIPVSYDWPLVLLSLIAAILASAAALFVAGARAMGPVRATCGSIMMGVGIGTMHYIGMAAMRMKAMCRFSPGIVALSVGLAIIISFVALWLVFYGREDERLRWRRKFVSAVVMGAAIPILHYTGMAAATFTISSAAPDLSHAVAVSTLGGVGIALVTIIVLGIAILTSAHDRLVHQADGSMRTRVQSTRIRAARAALVTASGMFGLETVKQILHPTITLWTSHLITIAFATVLAAGLSFLIMRKEEGIRFDLSTSGERYRSLFESCPVPMWVFDQATLKFLHVNEAAIRHYGFSSEEFLSMTIADIRPEEDVPALLEATRTPVVGLQAVEQWRHKKKDGTIIDVEIVSHDLDFHGSAAELVAAHDITRRQRAEQSLRLAEEKYRRIFEDAIVGIFQATPDGHPISINRALAETLGYESPQHLLAEVRNLVQEVFVHPKQMVELRHVLEEQGAIRGVELELYRKDGSKKSIVTNMRAVRDSGNLAFIEGTIEDITDRKRAEEKIQYLAYYDALTGLPNRTLLQDRLEKALASARRHNEKVGVLFLDLDQFKTINDTLGHSYGDRLLQEVADRLKRWAREQDTVARIGGDEFVIALTGLNDIPDAAVAAERIMDAMTTEFVVQGRKFNISCSVGISICPDHGADSETLVKNADAAMYCAKESGRNAFRFFTQEMNAQVVERLNIEHNLRQALVNNELFLMYQPQTDIATGKIIGLEALLRWRHPQMGLVPPDRFIRIAENTGLILPIGEWVLRRACLEARRWEDEGLAVPVAVNVSAVQFRQEGFRNVVRVVLRETGLAPHLLELELTESLLLSTGDRTFQLLQDFKAMGVKLAIDDFGTGYSSLSYLRQFPVNKLKIDRSFIKSVALNADDAAITAAIISMGKSLNLKVIAEGVEDDGQISFLQTHQCDEMQGYYFSKPLLPEEVADKLRSNRPRVRSAQQGSE